MGTNQCWIRISSDMVYYFLSHVLHVNTSLHTGYVIRL